VLDLSGWYAVNGATERTGNVVSWASNTNDTTAAWPAAFGPPYEVEAVTTVCNARMLVVSNGGALALWEAGDEDPAPKALSSARYENGVWGAAVSAGFAVDTFDPNDWAAAALGNEVHAVRYAGAGFVHRKYVNGQWTAGAGFPARAHPIGEGVSVVSDGAAIYAIALDAAGAVRSTSFAGAAWTEWKTDVPAGGNRTRPAAYAGAGGVAVVWADTAGIRRDVVGALLKR